MNSVVILHNHIPQNAPEDVLDILTQAKWIGQILAEKGWEVSLLPFSLQALEGLDASSVIFNLLDSAPNEESLSYLAAGILEHLGLRYTGCSLPTLLVTGDKQLTKALLLKSGLPTPKPYDPKDPQALYLIKATNQDASLGLDESCLVRGEDVERVLADKQEKLGFTLFAEQYIDGREFTVCLYGKREHPTILPPYEWVFCEYGQRAKIITYDAKWTEKTYGYEHIKAKYTHDEQDAPLLAELVRLSRECFKLFNLTGYARVDFRIDAENRPYILEINANPSFYGFYHLAKEWNFSFEDLVENLVLNAAVQR